MKMIRLTLALCALAFSTQAQITGQSTYMHAFPATLGSGNYVPSAPGFVMAGHRPTAAPGTPNFYIDKTAPGGGVIFSNGYQFSVANNCQGSAAPAINCYGVSVIPNSVGGYAVAAAFDTGITFALLNATGGVISVQHYLFAFGSTLPTKPVILESTISPGRYYVSGSFYSGPLSARYMYAMHLASGGFSWIFHYEVPNATTFDTKGLVESNYTGTPELVLAGTVNNGNDNGFFMRLNAFGGGVPIQFLTFNGGGVDQFTSIGLAASNGGYIIGGGTSASGPYLPWMLRLNANGTVDWSSQITPNATGASNVVGIAERFSTAYADYEYYGATVSGAGMLVLKLDNNGAGFSQGGNFNNEFLYNNITGAGSITGALSINTVPAQANTGIHVYGTSGGGFFLDQGCFNGATGTCASPTQQNLGIIPSTAVGLTPTGGTTSVNTFSGLGSCTVIALGIVSTGAGVAQPCNFGGLPVTPYAGLNLRSATNTDLPEGEGIISQAAEAADMAVYPNPTQGSAVIEYALSSDGPVKLELYNNLGQLIKTLEQSQKSSGSYRHELNMDELQVANGIYLLKLTVQGKSSLHKLVYSKD